VSWGETLRIVIAGRFSRPWLWSGHGSPQAESYCRQKQADVTDLHRQETRQNGTYHGGAAI